MQTGLVIRCTAGLHHINMVRICGNSSHYIMVLIHGYIQTEVAGDMSLYHNVLQLLIPEGEFVFISYWPVSHGSLEGLEVDKFVPHFNGHGLLLRWAWQRELGNDGG